MEAAQSFYLRTNAKKNTEAFHSNDENSKITFFFQIYFASILIRFMRCGWSLHEYLFTISNSIFVFSFGDSTFFSLCVRVLFYHFEKVMHLRSNLTMNKLSIQKRLNRALNIADHVFSDAIINDDIRKGNFSANLNIMRNVLTPQYYRINYVANYCMRSNSVKLLHEILILSHLFRGLNVNFFLFFFA